MQRGHRPVGRTAFGPHPSIDIAPRAVAVHDLAKEDCATVTTLRNEIAKLMPGISYRDRLRRAAE